MLVFIIIGLLGLALAVASLLLGDFIELADGALSGTSLGAGGMLFGATGMVVLSLGEGQVSNLAAAPANGSPAEKN